MLKEIQADKIYLAVGYTDLRRDIDGLANIVLEQFQVDPFSNKLFFFAVAKESAHIMTQKYLMATPIYRQEQAFKRQGIDLTRETMSNWLLKSTELWLEPLYEALRKNYLIKSCYMLMKQLYKCLVKWIKNLKAKVICGYIEQAEQHSNQLFYMNTSLGASKFIHKNF